MLALQAPHVPYHQPPAALVPPRYQGASTTRGMYEAMVASCDTVLGDVLDSLSQNGDLETTWIVVLGDNGPAKGSIHPSQSKEKVKGTTFEGGVNVPLVVYGPRVRRSFETRALVHVVDLLPTFEEILGRPVGHPQGEGVSLVPTFSSAEASVRSHVFVGIDKNLSSPMGPGGRLIDRAVLSERFKLRTVRDTLFSTYVEELYDRWQDPTESNPLDPDAPENVETASRLRRWLAFYP